jgi:hypothetical protein
MTDTPLLLLFEAESQLESGSAGIHNDVPCGLMRCGVIPSRRDDLLLSVPDIMPTLLSLMGAKSEIPQKVEGTDYSVLFQGGRRRVLPRRCIFNPSEKNGAFAPHGTHWPSRDVENGRGRCLSTTRKTRFSCVTGRVVAGIAAARRTRTMAAPDA